MATQATFALFPAVRCKSKNSESFFYQGLTQLPQAHSIPEFNCSAPWHNADSTSLAHLRKITHANIVAHENQHSCSLLVHGIQDPSTVTSLWNSLSKNLTTLPPQFSPCTPQQVPCSGGTPLLQLFLGADASPGNQLSSIS